MIKVENLCFSYTDKPFVQDINFSVKRGEIFGFLGPSGAGKSTLQKILTGLINNYEGSAVVNGIEVKKHTNEFYEHIGVDFEFPSLYEKLSAIENLKLFGGLYSGKLRDYNSLLKEIGLYSDKDKLVYMYSKGMKSRLNFVKSLIHNPDILFLDEPTSGLDPSNSRIMKDMILKEKSLGKTIIITTHNMVDATELCDEVVFIVDGQMKAKDSPHNLIMSKGATMLNYTYIENGEKTGNCKLSDISKDKKLLELIKENKLTTIHSSEPTLDDIFMEITGRKLS